MSYESNVYYHPEKHGLRVVAEIDFSSGSYEFDTLVVWKHEDGRMFSARDSGCSCPTPFENYNFVEDLERLDFQALTTEVESQVRMTDDYSSYGVSLAEARYFLDIVNAEMLR